jgi:hypothetical protein
MATFRAGASEDEEEVAPAPPRIHHASLLGAASQQSIQHVHDNTFVAQPKKKVRCVCHNTTPTPPWLTACMHACTYMSAALSITPYIMEALDFSSPFLCVVRT